MKEFPICARLSGGAEPGGVAGDALTIASRAISAVLPEAAVERALVGRRFTKPVTVIAVGKAAWRMARAAYGALGQEIKQGIVVTKYGHAMGAIGGFDILESGHPVPDENSFIAGARVLSVAGNLTESDECLLLLSGGGSALMEYPMNGVTAKDIADVTGQLLHRAADIEEINCIRKRLSRIKGGRLAKSIAPAHVFAVILSDVLGGRLDTIASGIVSPDQTTCAQARAIANKYHLSLSQGALAALDIETPKALKNVECVITGSVSALCAAAAQAAEELGYHAVIAENYLTGEARDEGRRIASLAATQAPPRALIYGGETVVHVTGKGRGGRNQELALAAAKGISGMKNACVLAVGSDGTDGPTDAAGGLVTGAFYESVGGGLIEKHLADNDAYPLLKTHGALVMTAPTGTNVNDLTLLLVQ